MGTTEEAARPGRELSAEPPAALLGIVPVAEGERLPFVPLRGMSLVDHATSALRRAGVEVVASDALPERLAGETDDVVVVVQDPLCPLTPPSFIAALIQEACLRDTVLAGVRPVTDTIKAVADGVVGETVDRESLLALASPVVLPPGVVAAMDDWQDLADLPALVNRLRARLPVGFRDAPSLGRRVEDESSVLLLEAFATLHPT